MDGSIFIGTWWSLVPSLLAIGLALATKEVYRSLFIGVAMGALLASLLILLAVLTVMQKIMGAKPERKVNHA